MTPVTGVSTNVFPVPSNALELWVFVAVALATLAAAIVAITRPTALGAAVAMFVSAVSCAGLFVAVSAPFLAVAFVLLLGGGLLGFFVFGVIMLNRADTEPVALRSLVMRGLGLLTTSLTLLYIARCLPEEERLAVETTALSKSFGNTASVGKALFVDLGFATQILAVFLLVGLISALALSRVITVLPGKE